jgi:site-specific DNA recombinase
MKVVLYSRVSSEAQDVDLSISAQLKALRDYAFKNGHQIVKEYVDEALSGKTADRPAFREMIAAARRSQKPFDLILVWKFSRFARNREDSIVFKTMLRKQGVRVISISEPSEDTPTGKLLEAMIESLDEFYSANLGEEVCRGMRESASRGFYLSAKPPYGYRKVKVNDGGKERPKLEIEPNHSQIVSYIYSLILQGNGVVEVAKRLNREGIAGPKSKGWLKTTIFKVATNEAYTGTLVWGRQSQRQLPPIQVENARPAIIDKGTFEHVQRLLSERAPVSLHPRRVASHFLLSGLAKCGQCGKALVGQDAKNGKFSYYVCGTLLKKGARSCSTRYLNSQQFERLVIDKIKEHVLTRDNLTRLVEIVNEEIDDLAVDYRQRLTSVVNDIEDIERRLTRLYDALETGKIKLDDLAPRIQELRKRQEQLQVTRFELEQQVSDRRIELADVESITGYVSDLHNLLNESSLPEKKSFVRSFIKEVKVTGEEALLTYTLPMLPKGRIEEKLPVLSIVHYGGDRGIRTPDLRDANATLSRLSHIPN